MGYKILNSLLLRHSPLREADEALTLWSWEEGKIRALARSVRKSESRLKSVFAPVAWLQLVVAPAALGYVVVGARVSRSYPRLLKNLNHLAIVFNLFETVMRATADRQENREVSVLLRESLEYLNSQPAANIDFLNDFRLRLLAALGYGITGATCRHCGRDLRREPESQWSSVFLGLICDGCASYDMSVKKVEREVAEYFFGSFARKAGVRSAPASAELKFKVERLLAEMTQSVIEQRLNSRTFLSRHVQF